MKIFSLQSKTGLVVWAFLVGLAADFTAYGWKFFVPTVSTPTGWPFIYRPRFFSMDCWVTPSQPHNCDDVFGLESIFRQKEFYFNLIFWVLIVFVALFIVRNFRKKNNQITSKV